MLLPFRSIIANGASLPSLIVGFGFAVLSQSAANAAITSYTSKAAFEAALNLNGNGFYEEPDMYTIYNSPLNSGVFSQGIFSYTVSASPTIADPLTGSDVLSTVEGPQDITPFGGPNSAQLTFTFGPRINAFGGFFYPNDSGAAFVKDSISVVFGSSSTPYTSSPESYEASFYGFISDGDYFTNAVLTAGDGTLYWPAAGSVIVSGDPVPGPSPVAAGVGFFCWSRRLRQRIKGAGQE